MEIPVKTVPSASAIRAFGWTGSTEISRKRHTAKPA
jgi:hypothetical protein